MTPSSTPHTPDLADIPHLTVMDAHCAICARGARWIARNDRRAEFRIVPMQSDLGRNLLVQHGLDPDDPTSWLYLDNAVPYSSLEAVIRVGQRLGGVWRGLGLLRLMPRRMQDALYYAVARNRYRLFGRGDLCAMPDPDVQQRLLQ
jgi:predicted DCC family thiol-disulfide oxidoreductase YuxK